MVDVNQLITFYHVVKAGSFVRAESLVGVQRSWISRQITDLENKVGYKLLERHYGNVTLTPMGETLYESAKKIIAETKIVESLLYESHTEPKGDLKVATTIGHATGWLPKYLAGFLNKYPDMRLSIVGSDENVDLESNEADVAIRPYVPKSPHLIHMYLLSYPLKLYASADYVAKFGAPKTPEDLDNHRLIAFSRNTRIPFGNVDWHLSLGCKPGHIRKPFLQINSALGLTRVVKDGLGIASISKYQEGLEGANLVEILPDIDGPMVDVHYVYPEILKDFKRITVLGEYLVEALEEESKTPGTRTFRRKLP